MERKQEWHYKALWRLYRSARRYQGKCLMYEFTPEAKRYLRQAGYVKIIREPATAARPGIFQITERGRQRLMKTFKGLIEPSYAVDSTYQKTRATRNPQRGDNDER